MPYRRSQFEDSPHSSRQNRSYHPATLLIIISLWIALVGNGALWQELVQLGRLQTAKDVWVATCMVLMIWGALVALGSLLAWRHSIKPLLVFFLIAAAAGMHFMMSYGVVIDDTMMINVFQTDPRETRDLLNARLFITLGLVAGLPCVWLWFTSVKTSRWGRQILRNALILIAGSAVLVGAIALSFQGFSSLMRNHKHVRYLLNPLNSLYAIGQIVTQPLRHGPQPLQAIGQDAMLGASYAAGQKPPLLMIVVGETARAANFSFNGYARQTTPQMAKIAQTESFVYWKDAWSCGTNTASSLPCMFSHLGKEAFEDSKARYEGLLDILQRAGLAILWIDNQSGCKGVCDRVANANTVKANVPEHCSSGECHDLVMLHDLDARIAALPADKRAKGVVVVLHQMGSHGPAYFKRVPPAFKTFQPECLTNNLSECTREQITNSYDNTLAYTDQLLFSSINWLKTKADTAQSAMIYVSDHGESLGEKGIYLHGLPYSIAPDEQKHIPWLNWFSAEFTAAKKLDIACLQQRATQRITHDNLFHSVLGLLDVKTSLHSPKLDVYAPCMKP
ncbi:phosphoethanolamine--lipid A transferase [Variovorax sp. PCZ-1]|uniref:phosphoethanolamine transferase n=1 Tax=Variovorax sp. PCZ-1 TaxID=2835533 RepID=UPI001BCAB0C2|nr:phosphoethanolamine--lipid A transferase [Variovorax sp. PCZ-1]MBS7807923.1 phosphoethanolamine--lipid A transferase [Variovorax sp. PCZ-1]